MQSASKGLGHFASGVRSMHVYAHAPRPTAGVGIGAGAAHHPPRPPASAQTSVSRQILQTTKTAVSRFIAHLTTPGFTHPVSGSTVAARGISTRANAAVRPQTIYQGLSLPARQAFSRPRHGPFVPRVPTAASKNAFQIGLGTARNFSTTRPLFQQFTANVPVTGRAIYEADWDIEKRKMKDKVKKGLKGKEKENIALTSSIRAKSVNMAEEFERYFPVAESKSVGPEVTTVLLVPLAPTPTSRLPLSETYSTEPTLLLVSDLQDILSTHRIHSLRVSSLFARLDACGVWEKGATFTAHGDMSGLCTVLRVEFKGWSEAMVKDVLGEAGKDWCRVVEIRPYDDMFFEGRSFRDESFRGNTSPSVTSMSIPSAPLIDPAASMVLPTLDFSASFLATRASTDVRSTPPMSPPMSPHGSDASSPLPSISEFSYAPSDSSLDVDMHTDTAFDTGAQYEFDSDSFADVASQYAPSSGSMISFSSDFIERSHNAALNDTYDVSV